MTNTSPRKSSAFAPFAAVEIPFSSIPAAGTPEYAEFVAHYLSSAFAFVRGTPEWNKTKAFNTDIGGNVQCKVLPSQVQQLAKKGWHLRGSQHGPEYGLTFEDFRSYLRFQHPTFERQYIQDITLVQCVHKVKEDETEIWHNAYRDFVQMLLTIDLPPHPEPFSEAHQAATLAWVRDPSRTIDPPSASTEPAYRSFLVLQIPISHPDYPQEPPKVCAVYSSFEAVFEAPAADEQGAKAVNWKMAVQSDTRGRIPTMMQEMAMPGEIAHDVHAFIGWANKYKAENPPAANN
ncbi:uncharacterized protein UHOD_02977 [Ustilago sp. UG-2017b]|nr:uncharacterized protein UHOD_02977 [Ustilago sp. UG-2017b]